MAAPSAFLSRAEEQSLLARVFSGDQSARERIVLAYMPLVRKIAQRYKTRLSHEDLCQEGVLGLMTALAKFEPERNLRFGTYASWWVRAAIGESLLKTSRVVRPSTSRHGKRDFVEGKIHTEVSLNAPGRWREDGEPSTLQNILPDERPLPDEIAQLAIDGDRVVAALETLDARRRYVIQKRFLADPPQTLDAISRRMGISKERVRQLEGQALEALRKVCG